MNSKECIICMESLGSDVVSLECAHVFHISCITNWLKRSDKCPVCKHVTEMSDYNEEKERADMAERITSSIVKAAWYTVAGAPSGPEAATALDQLIADVSAVRGHVDPDDVRDMLSARIYEILDKWRSRPQQDR